jgi:hypothetical protein
MRNRLTREELIDLVEDESTIDGIIDLQREIREYTYFKQAREIGITFTPKDLTFSKMLLFSSIRECIDGK